jgi:acyl-coenzyme A synthetase/AMP-(fatty) acid ligase/thioesterase domain-containing protein/acyl carrier protein
MALTRSGPTLPFDDDALNESIPARFSRVVSAYPDRTAVVAGGRSLTFRRLDRLSGDLSQALRVRLGDGPEPVGLLFKNDLNMITAIIGVIGSGKFYCALNPTDPALRMKNILADLKTRLLITDAAHRDLAVQAAPEGCVIGMIEDLIAAPAQGLPPLLLPSTALAGIFYTSGSTGMPKGVPRDHGTILHRCWLDVKDVSINPDDRLFMLRFCCFSSSLMDIFTPLLNGASIYLQDMEDLDLNSLPKVIQQEEITWLDPPLELFRFMIDALPEGTFFQRIRAIIIAGDVLYKKDVEHIRPLFPKDMVIIHNLSSSESGILSRSLIRYDTQIDGDIVPVGCAVPGKELLILGEDGQILDAGQAGEIAVRSRFGFRQYWNMPEQTDKKFIADPDDPAGKLYLTGDLGRLNPRGQMEFIGRKDFQEKIRGFRVDLSAVENTLMAIGGILRAVVVARPDSDGMKSLVAYVLFSKGVSLPPATLQARLAEILPEYMIPGIYVPLDRFPLTPTGKVDRQSLPEPDERPEQLESQPQDTLEMRLADIWKQVLGLKYVGVNDEFSTLGGHSLSALRIIAQIQKEFSLESRFEPLVQATTVAQQAKVIRDLQYAPSSSCLVPIQPRGSLPPFFCASPTVIDVVTYRDLSCALGSDQPFYALYESSGAQTRAASQQDQIDAFVEAVHRVQPSGPYYLGGYSGGGTAALRMAHRLQAGGEQVRLVVLFDSFAPGYFVLLPWVTPRMYNFLRVLRRVQSYLWKFWILNWREKRNLLFSGERPFRSRFRDWFIKRRQELDRPNKRLKGRSGAEEHPEYEGYSGKVVLLRARQGIMGVRHNASLGWDSYLSPPPEVQVIPGDHEAILFGPRLPKVAAILKDCLQRAYPTD